MMKEQKYTYNGTVPEWLPGVGVIKPGQTFSARFALNNPKFTPTADVEVTPVGNLSSEDKVCKDCVTIKNKDKSTKKKE